MRKIRSFVKREGRLTAAQKAALEAGTWLIRQLPVDWEANFGAPGAKHVVELGFGDGASLLTMAEANPLYNYIGIEVYRAGVGNLLNKITQAGIKNLRVIMADAEEILDSAFADGSIDAFQIFFPDPWHKKRHHKRRLLDAEFVDILVRKLKIGGTIHTATDWADYAAQMLTVLSAHPALQRIPNPDPRPTTKYEKRGLRLGHEIFDLQFIRKTTF